MSTSSPDDLAVAFRSLPRRLRQASTHDVAPEAITRATNELQRSISAAASLMTCTANADNVADAIQRRRTAEWTDDQLLQLQTCAQSAGRALRDLEDLASSA